MVDYFKLGFLPSVGQELAPNHILLVPADARFQNFGPEVEKKASIYVPAIGKVTIVVLIRNLLMSTIISRLDFNADGREAYCSKSKSTKI